MKYTIINSDFVTDPRNWENLTTMVCFHSRYILGDYHEYNVADFNSWEELENGLRRDNEIVLLRPLYLLDHSGLTVSTTPFNDRWDSGQIGFVFVTRDKLLKHFGGKKVSKKLRDRAEILLDAEVVEYDLYLRGETYAIEFEDGIKISGFIGYDSAKEFAEDYVKTN